MPQPNVVYLVAHDLRADVSGPNLAALRSAEGSVSFTAAFSQAPYWCVLCALSAIRTHLLWTSLTRFLVLLKRSLASVILCRRRTILAKPMHSSLTRSRALALSRSCPRVSPVRRLVRPSSLAAARVSRECIPSTVQTVSVSCHSTHSHLQKPSTTNLNRAPGRRCRVHLRSLATPRMASASL